MNGVETTSEGTKVLGFRAAANLFIHYHNGKQPSRWSLSATQTDSAVQKVGRAGALIEDEDCVFAATHIAQPDDTE